jgi:hypothetical protein
MRRTQKIPLVSFYGILMLIVASCTSIDRFLQSQEPELVYWEEVRSTQYPLRDSYDLSDSLAFGHFLYCAESGKNGSKKYLKCLDINIDTVRHQLVEGLQKTNLPIKTGTKIMRVDSNAYCELRGFPFEKYVVNLLEKEEYSFLKSKSEPKLFLACNYGAYWEQEVDIVALAGSIPTDRRYYRVRRQLCAVITEYDTIAYASHYVFHDTAYVREPSELPYEFPQEIMDSLVILTLKEYKERLQ